MQRQHDKVGRHKMKTKILFVVLLGFFSGSVMNAQTNISGLISSNTTWDLAGSPYIIVGNTMVDNDVTLTIDAGVTVKFDDLMALQINGQLIARGSSGNEIKFTSLKSNPASGDWGFIAFSTSSIDAVYDLNGNYSSGSILEYCVIEYAGGGTYTTGAVMMDDAHPFIHYCTIRHNEASGINATNLTGILKIINNTISDNTTNTGGGISIRGGHAIITGNYIGENYALGVGSYGGGGIFAYDNIVEIFNNLIEKNTATGYGAGGGGAGIYVNQGSATISKNIIRNNMLLDTVNGEGGGILIYTGDAVITRNSITDNKAGKGGGIFGGGQIVNNCISGNSAQRGGGIYMSQKSIMYNSIINNTSQIGSVIDIYIADNTDSFSYNSITGNKTTGEDPVYSIGISSLPLFSFNNIFDNTTTYELYNNNGFLSPNLNAKNNWWGTSSDALIQNKIFDWVDDASKGIVEYSPFLTSMSTDAPVSPPAGLSVVAGSGQLSLTWTANSEADIAGYKVYWGTINNYPYENSIDAGNVTSYTINGLLSETYFATVTAYDNNADTVADDPNTIVNEKQCAGNESWYAKPVSVVGINETERNTEIIGEVFPNPTSRNFSINVPPAATQIQILNSSGQLVKKTTLNGQTNFNFDLMTSGTYILQVITDKQIITRKIIVNK